MTDDTFVLGCVKGYKLIFDQKVEQFSVPTVSFQSETEENNVYEAIEKLLEKGAIRQCSPCKSQFLSSYFLVQKPDGSYRFILNLKKLNKFMNKEHFKLEDLRSVTKLIQKGGFMTSIDLEDAYLTVPIHEESRRYLRFMFRGKFYEFRALPFGLCVSPFVFTKVMKPVVRFFRSKGYTLIVYMDDFWLFARSYKECLDQTRFVSNSLQKVGFIVNDKKSDLSPSRICTFLGFVLNSEDFTIKITEEKVVAIQSLLETFSNKKTVTIQQFESLIGTLSATCMAIPYGRLYTKTFEREKMLALEANGQDNKKKMSIPDTIRPDLLWWRNNIAKSCRSLENKTVQMTIFSDASKTG